MRALRVTRVLWVKMVMWVMSVTGITRVMRDLRVMRVTRVMSVRRVMRAFGVTSVIRDAWEEVDLDEFSYEVSRKAKHFYSHLHPLHRYNQALLSSASSSTAHIVTRKGILISVLVGCSESHKERESERSRKLSDLPQEWSKIPTSKEKCKYALDILQEAGILNGKPLKSPMVQGQKLTSNDGTPLAEASCSRVGILKHHQGRGYFIPSTVTRPSKLFSDSDWAACAETRRSIIGYCVFFGSSFISWRSKKQATVSRSSSEAEYRALAATTCELQWLAYLLDDLQIQTKSPAAMFCDNKFAVAIAENHVFYERTKHINIDCDIVLEKLVQGLIKLLPMSSANQVDDGFTEPLSVSPFQSFVSKLGIRDLHIQYIGE
nr:uncharacterized protein LOC109189527 [Ipomoea batatas]